MFKLFFPLALLITISALAGFFIGCNDYTLGLICVTLIAPCLRYALFSAPV